MQAKRHILTFFLQRVGIKIHLPFAAAAENVFYIIFISELSFKALNF